MPSPVSTGRRDAAIIAALVLLPLVLFPAETLGRRVFLHHDLQYYFYPYRKLAMEIIAQGHLPLWNPYAFSGLPLLGDGQTAIFYPPNWLFWLLPAAQALTLGILLQFGIAGVGTYLYARRLGLDPLIAALAALIFMFNGFLVARVVHPSIMAGAALLPWVCWGYERLLQRVDGRAFVAAAAAVAMQLVAGHPQVPVYTAVALGIYALTIALHEPWVARGRGGPWRLARPLVLLAGVYLVGTPLAAIQLIPWFELSTLSPRAAFASYKLVAEQSLVGVDWLLFLFPFGYGGLRQSWLQSLPVDPASQVYLWERTAYVGIVTLALAGIGLGRLALPALPRSRRKSSRRAAFRQDALSEAIEAGRLRAVRLRALVAALVVLALIAAGDSTPIGRLVYALPMLGQLRAYGRAIAIAPLALAILAACGAERVWSGAHSPAARPRPDRVPIVAGTLLLGTFVAVFLVAELTGPHPPRALDTVRDAAVDPAAPQMRQLFLDRALRLDEANAALPLTFAVAGATILCTIGLGLYRDTPRLRAVALAGVVAVDLLSFAAAFNPATDPGVLSSVPAAATFLRGDPAPVRIAIFDVNDTQSPDRAREQLAVSWAIPYGIEDINGFNSLQPRRYTDFLFGTSREDVSYGVLRDARLLEPGNPILSLLNVRYALVPSSSRMVPGTGWRKVFASDAVTIYRNPTDYGRAFFVDQVRVETDARAVLARVTATGFDPRREALVESGPDPATLAALARDGAAAGDDAATVRVERPSPNELLLHTHTEAARFLMLSEMWFPGWRAELVGGPPGAGGGSTALPIYRTDYLFRGLIVPAGDHTIRMVYRPTSARLGALVTLATVAGCVVLCLMPLLARRTRSRSEGGGGDQQGRGALPLQAQE